MNSYQVITNSALNQTYMDINGLNSAQIRKYDEELNLAKQSYLNRKYRDCLVHVITLLSIRPGHQHLVKIRESLERTSQKRNAVRTKKAVGGTLFAATVIMLGGDFPGIDEDSVTKVTKFGTLSVLYDWTAISSKDVQNFGRIFQDRLHRSKDTKYTVRLSYKSGVYQIKLPIKPEYVHNASVHQYYKEIAKEASEKAFGGMLTESHICDTKFATLIVLQMDLFDFTN